MSSSTSLQSCTGAESDSDATAFVVAFVVVSGIGFSGIISSASSTGSVVGEDERCWGGITSVASSSASAILLSASSE